MLSTNTLHIMHVFELWTESILYIITLYSDLYMQRDIFTLTQLYGFWKRNYLYM